MKFYKGSFFRFDDHIERLKYSIKNLEINYNSFEEIPGILSELIKLNSYAGVELLCYIQITRGVLYPRSHNFPEEISPTVFINIYPAKSSRDEQEKGTKVILDEDLRWHRCDIKSISLLPAILQKAAKQKASEAVLVRNGFITEGTHTNFCGIKNGILFTHPLDNNILAGITRKVVLEICKEEGIEIKEEPIPAEKIYKFDELFILGTSTEVTPVVQVENQLIANGKPGKLSRKIQQKFREKIFL